ncbi:hypothetical protein GCM10029978_070650 [Actinoallomurus acanthiterrae]
MSVSVDEVPGQFEVSPRAGLPVQLDEAHLDRRVTVQLGAPAGSERLGEMVGEPDGDPEQPGLAPTAAPGGRDSGCTGA